MKRHGIALTASALLLMISGCEQSQQSTGPRYGTEPKAGRRPVYSLTVHPLHTPAKLVQTYQPLIDYLNDKVKGERCTLQASKDYANFERN